MNDRPISEFLAALESVTGRKPTRNGCGWQSLCPAHTDKRPSLSIAEGDDGRVLVHCHAGCRAEDIVARLGMSMHDLMPTETPSARSSNSGRERKRNKNSKPPQTYPTATDAIAALEQQLGPHTAAWTYRDADGEPVGLVVRWNKPDGKDIRPVCRTRAGWSVAAMPTPRPLYNLTELLARPGETVLIVEGEKVADALADLGYLVTTSAGGNQAVRQSDWALLAGRDVVILPDADDAGEKYASAVATTLTRLRPPARVRIMRTTHNTGGNGNTPYMELSAKEDAHDWIAQQRKYGRKDATIRADLDALVATALEYSRPAAPAIERYQPFPVNVLPDPMRAFVRAVAAGTGTDPAFAATASLVVAVGCIGNRVAVRVKNSWTQPAVLWGALIGRSGTTKSPVLKLVTRQLVEVFKTERAAFRAAMEEHSRETERYAVRLADWKNSQREGPPTDPPVKPTLPTQRRLIVDNITIEKLGELLEQNPLGLLAVCDELAAWVGAFDRYVSGRKGGEQPAWLAMYDAATVTIDRKSGKGTYFVDRAAVSVLGTIQPGTLARSFGIAEREGGLLARILVVYPPDHASLWTDADLPDEIDNAWRELLKALLAFPVIEDETGNPRPSYLPLSADAKARFVEWHDRHVRETVANGDEDLRAHFDKLKGVCVRFALLFTCVEVAAGGSSAAAIDADAMRRAITLVEWYKREARRVYAILGESETQRAHRTLIEWIVRRGGSATVRDLTHNLNRYRNDSESAQADLDVLVEQGAGYWEHLPPGSSGGRPTTPFVLHNTNTETKAGDALGRGFGGGADDATEAPPRDDAEPLKLGVDGDGTPESDDEYLDL